MQLLQAQSCSVEELQKEGENLPPEDGGYIKCLCSSFYHRTVQKEASCSEGLCRAIQSILPFFVPVAQDFF